MTRFRVRDPRWWIFAVALALSVVLVAALAYAFYGPGSTTSGLPSAPSRPSTPWVEIDGVDLIFTYIVGSNGTSGYLSPSPECDGCPENVTPGLSWTFQFTIDNTDANHSHTVTEVALDAPFILSSSTPTFPQVVSSGGQLTVTLTIQVPNAPGYYLMSGSITAK